VIYIGSKTTPLLQMDAPPVGLFYVGGKADFSGFRVEGSPGWSMFVACYTAREEVALLVEAWGALWTIVGMPMGYGFDFDNRQPSHVSVWIRERPRVRVKARGAETCPGCGVWFDTAYPTSSPMPLGIALCPKGPECPLLARASGEPEVLAW